MHAQRLDMRDARVRGHGRELVAAGGIADEDARLRVAEEILDLRRRVGRVERKEDRARAQAREIQQNRVRRFLDLHGDAIARRHAARAQKVRDARRARMKIAIGDLARFRRLDEDFLRRGRAARDEVVQIGGHVSPLICEPSVARRCAAIRPLRRWRRRAAPLLRPSIICGRGRRQRLLRYWRRPRDCARSGPDRRGN